MTIENIVTENMTADNLAAENMTTENIVTLLEAEYAEYRYCLAKVEKVWDSLPQGYLHTINPFGEDLHYHYLPPPDPDKKGTLAYLDKSQQSLIDALAFKTKLASDISIIHQNLSLLTTFLVDCIPPEEILPVLEKLIMEDMEGAEFFIVLRRRCVSWKSNNRTGKRRPLTTTQWALSPSSSI